MKKKGFTLVELIAVIAVLAILMLLIIPNVINLYQEAKTNAFVKQFELVNKAIIDQYGTDLALGEEKSVYCNAKEGCTKAQVDDEVKYFAKVNNNGDISYLAVSDGNYCYSTNNITKKIDVSRLVEGSELSCSDNICKCEGDSIPEPVYWCTHDGDTSKYADLSQILPLDYEGGNKVNIIGEFSGGQEAVSYQFDYYPSDAVGSISDLPSECNTMLGKFYIKTSFDVDYTVSTQEVCLSNSDEDEACFGFDDTFDNVEEVATLFSNRISEITDPSNFENEDINEASEEENGFSVAKAMVDMEARKAILLSILHASDEGLDVGGFSLIVYDNTLVHGAALMKLNDQRIVIVSRYISQ